MLLQQTKFMPFLFIFIVLFFEQFNDFLLVFYDLVACICNCIPDKENACNYYNTYYKLCFIYLHFYFPLFIFVSSVRPMR